MAKERDEFRKAGEEYEAAKAEFDDAQDRLAAARWKLDHAAQRLDAAFKARIATPPSQKG